jgi:hypothetical protein
MNFHGKEGDYLLGMSLGEMKILYRSLWNDLKRTRTLGIDEEASDLLHDLQTVLQKEATRLGVDVGLHSAWAEFVGLDSSCSIRSGD